jgi:FkbH-like protein
MDYPKEWPESLKNIIDKAYKTNKFTDIRNALKLVKGQLSANNEKKINIGILRTYTIETLIDCLQLSLSAIPCRVNITLGGLDSIEQDLFDKESSFLQSSLEVIVILWRIEDLLPKLVWEVDSMSLKERRDSYNMLIERIKRIVEQYDEDAPLIVSTFFVPDYWKNSLNDKHRGYGIIEIVYKVNLFLYRYATLGKIRIFDVSQWLGSVGNSALNEKMNFFARQPFDPAYGLSFADSFTKVIRPLLLTQSKVLAIDLDNTLWGGVLGEDGIENLNIGKDYPGSVYWRIQQTLISLKNRGVLLVLLSKNNITDVTKAFDSLIMPLKLSDFIKLKVNWELKYKNLKEVAEELGLGVDSFVFLDDQKFEQGEMKALLPDVKTISNSGDPLNILESIVNSYYFDSFSIEKEDLSRNKDYKNQINRKKLEDTLDREGFLYSLELKANIESVSSVNLQRVIQMILKTNQFNLTTRRHSSSTVNKLISTKGSILITISLRDKFGDQGVVGLCIAVKDDTCDGGLIVDTFLMSCRALSRGAEDVLWCALMKYSSNKGYKILRAEYIETNKNMQVSDFYSRMGMELENDKNATQYILDVTKEINFPSWIDVSFAEE